MTKRRRNVLTTATVALALLAPAATQASSIVFIKNHNVWLANANGSGQARVTRDGTAANPYYSPSQADNGTIVALRGPDGRPTVATFSGGGSRIHRLAPSGKLLGPPRISLFEPLESIVPRALSAEVSPNGRTVALGTLLYEVVRAGGRRTLQPKVLYVVYKDAASGRDRGKSDIPLLQLQSPSWIDNRRLLIFDQYSQAGPQVYVATVGRKPTPFYRDPGRSDLVPDWNGFSLGGGELTRAGDKLAAVRAKIGGGQRTIEIYATSRVSRSPTQRCTLARRNLGPEPSLSWSPDGATLTWFEGSGIWSSPVKLTAQGCGLSPRLIIRGGISPDWGPANVRRR